jgi:hypothetical protein
MGAGVGPRERPLSENVVFLKLAQSSDSGE